MTDEDLEKLRAPNDWDMFYRWLNANLDYKLKLYVRKNNSEVTSYSYSNRWSSKADGWVHVFNYRTVGRKRHYLRSFATWRRTLKLCDPRTGVELVELVLGPAWLNERVP